MKLTSNRLGLTLAIMSPLCWWAGWFVFAYDVPLFSDVNWPSLALFVVSILSFACSLALVVWSILARKQLKGVRFAFGVNIAWATIVAWMLLTGRGMLVPDIQWWMS